MISFILNRVSDISAKTSPPYMGIYLVIRDSEFGKTRTFLYNFPANPRGICGGQGGAGAGFSPSMLLFPHSVIP